MPTFSLSTQARRYLYLAVVVLIALNGALLWRDYHKTQEMESLRHRLYDMQARTRVLESEQVFGEPFVPLFRVVDLQEQPAILPYLGEQQLLLLFFQTSHCTSCLQAMSLFESEIAGNVPVVGVAQSESAAEVKALVEEHGYEFPVYLAVGMRFELAFSPYSVLIDKSRNILHLTAIEPVNVSVPQIISEVAQVIERR